MCGRYMITSSFEAMARLFEAGLADLGPELVRRNVSPTEPVPVVVSHDGDRLIVPMRWGFLPTWYKAPNDRPLIINARAEDIADQARLPRRGARARRCLIPADGFYEWQGEKGARTPFRHPAGSGGLDRLRRHLAGLARARHVRDRHLRSQRPVAPDPRADAGAGRAG